MKKLCRATYDKKVFGVCGGIADYFAINSTLVRIIALVLTFCVGITIPVYVAAAILMPQSEEY